MNIPAAIGTLLGLQGWEAIKDTDIEQGLRLGIEALERIKRDRENTDLAGHWWANLPSETEEK